MKSRAVIGSPQERFHMKKSALLLPITLLTLGGCSFLKADNTMINYGNFQNYTAGGATLDGPVDSLEIEWIDGPVEINLVSGSAVTFFEDSDADITENTSMYYWLERSKLHLKFAASGSENFTMTKKLTVNLPLSTVLRSLELDLVSGFFTASDFKIERAVINSVAAPIELESMDIPELTVSTVAGDVDMSDCAVKTVKISGVSSDINVKLSRDIPGFEVDYTSVAGRLKSDFTLEKKDGRQVYGDGSVLYTVDTVSGGLRFEHSEP